MQVAGYNAVMARLWNLLLGELLAGIAAAAGAGGIAVVGNG